MYSRNADHGSYWSHRFCRRKHSHKAESNSLGCLHEDRRTNWTVWFVLKQSKHRLRRLTGNTAAGGAAHGFGKAAAANLREKDDSWNPAIAGFMSGALLGLSCEVNGSERGYLY